MPTRVLLEGPAIEPLLAQVRDEYGSRVRIISADKVRSGGVGGFFAKQHYELSVEVPDPNEDRSDMAQRTKTADTGQHSLERLLERAESQDRMEEPGRGANRPFGTSSPRSVTPASFGMTRPGEQAARPTPENIFGTAARPTPAPSPENGFGADEGRSAALGDTGAAFAELMAGLDAGPAADRLTSRPKPAPKEDTPTVRPFRPAAASESPVNIARTPTPPAMAPISPAAMPPAAFPGTPAAFAETPAAFAETPAPPAPIAAQVSPAAAPVSPAPSLAERIGGLVAATVEVEDEPVVEPEPEPAPVETYGFRPVSAVPATPVHIAEPAADNEPVVRNLMSVGMPETMARQITGSDTYAGVLSVLAARPSAPGIPDGPGEILVLAGDINLGVLIGRQLLDAIGVAENHLLLAAQSTAGTGLHSSRLISTPEAAETRAEKLHGAEEPWVVVLEAPVGGTDPIWVNEMCDAIGATALWAIVDATRKTADTGRHLRTLGEVESLVVHGVELTADPASVLGLELPIHSLDGKPATPHAWAAMLCARIASDVMPVAAAPRRVTRSARQ
ncbi:hypothetical protein KOI35_06255 [Actinoplanes bogorensis]|uniref:Uncharacterized protein n=1 Tax=Paractinoplanes bogorensis TaxID=1610840 RepID=A0ABS5YK89_9ACTN|nr:hypothetical protein [Actinoplanes bogorensis]MBU2663108.1 hypothetical protein [Actinoplanes bogorensis]